MEKKYYLTPEFKRKARLVLILTVAHSVGLFAVLYFIGILRQSTALVVGLFVLLSLSVLLLTLRRFRLPEVEITESSIVLYRSNYSYMFKKVTINWIDIEGMAINAMQIKSKIAGNSAWKIVKLLLKSDSATTKEIYFSLRGVERPEELIEELVKHIPAVTVENFRLMRVAHGLVDREISYRNLKFTPTGILKHEKVILWKNITSAAIQGQVIAGYGATMIVYRSDSNTEETIVIPPGLSTRYFNIIRYIINKATNASIDPGLIKALQYPPSDAVRDMVSIVLLILSIIAMIPAGFIVADYAQEQLKVIFYSLLVFCIVAPFIISVFLLSARSRGRAVKSSVKIIWSLATFIGPFIVVALLLFVSPYSWNYVRGDIEAKTGDLAQAEFYYMKALEIKPDSPDVIFSLGIVYQKRQLFQKAFELFEKAYKKDPNDWGPPALEMIPDSLMRMGKYDEAIAWCDKILSDLKKNRPKLTGTRGDGFSVKIKQVILNKRSEIMQEKARQLNH